METEGRIELLNKHCHSKKTCYENNIVAITSVYGILEAATNAFIIFKCNPYDN